MWRGSLLSTTTLGAPLAAALLGLAPALVGCSISYEFEPVSIGDDGAGRAPTARSNSQFVRAVYADLVGRAPEVYSFSLQDAQGAELFAFPVNEQRDIVAALDATGDPDALRAIVTTGLLGSSEVSVPDKDEVSDPRAFIRDEFRALLGREPRTYELHAFEQAWSDDDATGPRAVVRAIIGSREYQSR